MSSVLVLLAFASVLVACGDDEEPGSLPTSPAPASSTPAPTVEPSLAAAQQQALAAYEGYIQTYALASQAADPDDPNLARYVADPLLGQSRRNIRKLKDIGAVQLGAQKASVVRSEANLSAKPPAVTIFSCLDFSDMKVVYRSNQSPIPGFSISKTRAPAVVTVWQYETGQWLVNATKEGSHSC
ncbi:hypothetical protein [Phytohabitans aurantiacus]|uniref:hypothetical protein n=1 Tax=Phytohabitans aurantiacus TaxID=3016789 RepID=UPI002492BA63|nr:hypothetical protein [Phytohabitans aurantiacus]